MLIGYYEAMLLFGKVKTHNVRTPNEKLLVKNVFVIQKPSTVSYIKHCYSIINFCVFAPLLAGNANALSAWLKNVNKTNYHDIDFETTIDCNWNEY